MHYTSAFLNFNPIHRMKYIIFPHLLVEMHWAAIIAAVISLGAAYYQTEQQKKAESKRREFESKQGDIAKSQQRIAEQEYARFVENYAPIEKEISDISQRRPREDLVKGRAVADVQRSFSKKEGIRRRDAGRYGLDPSSGRFASLERKDELDRAKTEVGTVDIARQREEDKAWSRKLSALKVGKNLPENASSILGSVGNTYGNIANRYSRDADSYGRGANRGWESVGYWGGKAYDNWDKSSQVNDGGGNNGYGPGTQQDGYDDGFDDYNA